MVPLAPVHVLDAMPKNQGVVCVCCGVCGSGKTTIARLLSRQFDCIYIDADDLHSEVAREKMSQGVPLSEEERLPWLRRVAHAAADSLVVNERFHHQRVVSVACSALTQRYRSILATEIRGRAGKDENVGVVFALLTAPLAVLRQRVHHRARTGAHFFHPDLLGSQLALLEPLAETEGPGLTIDAATEETNSPEKMARTVWAFIGQCLDEGGSFDPEKLRGVARKGLLPAETASEKC